MTEQTDGRWCRRCGEWRSLDDFLTDDVKALCGECRERVLTRQRDRRAAAGPEAVRASNLWSKYRIRPEEYDRLRIEQGHRCAICGTHEDEMSASRGGRRRLDGSPPAEGFRLVVDHCHNSKEVRGLLCVGCNSALGLLRDSPEVLAAAIRYLTRAWQSVNQHTA